MAIKADILHTLTKGSPEEAWQDIIASTLEIAGKPLEVNQLPGEIINRDRKIGEFDHFLATSGWELWQLFSAVVEKTSDRLIRWWTEPYHAKAALILDGLSLRELPWLLQGAKEHGFTLQQVAATASELPGKTNEFAHALGFNSRSQLQNNGGGFSHKLQPASTECVDMPWRDCQALIDSAQNWIFWHQWPDSKLHDGAGAGQGLEILANNAKEQLAGKEFWNFVERLATGRKLVITSDHGYAATGHFSDADGDVAQFLKQTFASGRSAVGANDPGPFIPPVALNINNMHGEHLLALGQRKWRSQGGYPTLAHGGLSLLEVLSPWIEITKN